MPAPSALFALILFGAIGMAAVVYGKKSGSWKPIIIGITLMIYPHFIAGALPLYLLPEHHPQIGWATTGHTPNLSGRDPIPLVRCTQKGCQPVSGRAKSQN